MSEAHITSDLKYFFLSLLGTELIRANAQSLENDDSTINLTSSSLPINPQGMNDAPGVYKCIYATGNTKASTRATTAASVTKSLDARAFTANLMLYTILSFTSGFPGSLDNKKTPNGLPDHRGNNTTGQTYRNKNTSIYMVS